MFYIRENARNTQRGFFIGIILLVSFLVIALSVTMHHQLGSVAQGVKKNERSLQLEWVARSGLEASVARLRENNDLDGPQPELDIPDIPGAVYESIIFNNLKGNKDYLNPEAPGALSPDGKAWVPNGTAYVQVVASFTTGGDGSGEMVFAAASGTAGYGGYSFNSGILANNSLSTEDSSYQYYDKNYADGAPVVFNPVNDIMVIDDSEDGIIKVNNKLELKGAVNVSGSIQVHESRVGRVDRSQLVKLAGARKAGKGAIVPTRKKGFIPRALTPTGLGNGSLYVAGSSFDIRSLYPSKVDALELHDGLLRLSGKVYHVDGDIVLEGLSLESFGNESEPTTLIVDGNVALDGVRANYYGNGIPGDPLALKILVQGTGHQVTVRNSDVSAVICAAEGSVKFDNSDVFGFVAAEDVTTKGSNFFVPLGDLKKNISLMGQVDSYEVQDTFVASEDSVESIKEALNMKEQLSRKSVNTLLGASKKVVDIVSRGNIGVGSTDASLAENFGFAPEPPMPGADTSSLKGPVKGLASNSEQPAPLTGSRWEYTAEAEVVSAPSDGIVGPGTDKASGIPVTVYDPPANATPACFPAGVIVTTPNGPKAIETLKVGDAVVTYSDQFPASLSHSTADYGGLGRSCQVSAIEKIFVHPESRIGRVKLKRLRDDKLTELEVTGEHMVYSDFFKRWRPINSLPKGSILQSPTGRVEIIEAWSFKRTGVTYNFELLEHHTYCVGDLEVWVHNYKEPALVTRQTSNTSGGGTGGGSTGGSKKTPTPTDTKKTPTTGGGGGGCFVAGTPVMTPKGAVAIESLSRGDEVMSLSENNTAFLSLQGNIMKAHLPSLNVGQVSALFVHYFHPVGNLKLDAQGQSEVIEVTYEHPFFSVQKQDWVQAGQLSLGEEVWSAEGPILVSGPWTYTKDTTVYNFEVANDHTYFVGGLKAWVHNLVQKL